MTTEYLSFKQAMQFLVLKSYKSIKKLINLGLPVVEVGQSKKISKTAIDEFMKAHTVIAKEKK